jgi:peptidoglycan-associated lipoprotein
MTTQFIFKPGVTAAWATAALLAGCANPSYVALLDNGDGTTGKVQISTPYGTTQLDKPRQGTRFTGPTGETFEVTQDKLNKDFGAAMAASPKKPVSFLLYFEVGGAKLSAESEADLVKILEEVNTRQVPDISVIGHTDTLGDDAANEKLGLERARFVAELINRDNKIDVAKIAIESHGEKNLLVPTPDNTDEPRNRRVEVTIR